MRNSDPTTQALFDAANTVRKELQNAPIGSTEYYRLLRDYKAKKALFDDARQPLSQL